MTQWINGFRVEISDWYDGIHDYMGICYVPPGGRLDCPDAEQCYLFPKAQRKTFLDYLYSIVTHLTSRPEFWEPYRPEKITILSVERPEIHFTGGDLA